MNAKIIEKSMMSYSASFEDVILQRALQDVEQGCYIDVGASRPLGDSNTAAFYGKGWRGICIEPLAYLSDAWSKCRPEDILINAVAGAEPGETTLYYYSSTTQISTCSVETMEHWKRHNQLSDEQKVVPVVTLNDVMEEFLGDRTIHLLSIDVEGSEKQVLRGFDLKKYQPWIIIIEATVPGTHTPAHESWENDVLEAGYTMVYKDGINRFYLSNLKSELRHHFLFPPNVWDGFVSYNQELVTTKCAQLEESYEKTRKEVEALQQSLAHKVPPTFWEYVPRPDDLSWQHKLEQLEIENKQLKNKIKGLRQSLALKNYLAE